MGMSKNEFRNYDDEVFYKESQEAARDQKTRNFLVQFGKDEAQIAFDVTFEKIKSVLEESNPPSQRPVRWINIWGPDLQTKIVEYLGERYGFSLRLLATICTKAPGTAQRHVEEEKASRLRARKQPTKEADIELASATSVESQKEDSGQSRLSQGDISHYTLAEQMINYVSNDSGERYLCIGCNWMHKLSKKSDDISIAEEGEQRRLWTWLVLCNDFTVISLHENPGLVENPQDVKIMRGNTLSVLSQLSQAGNGSADAISLQAVRQALKDNSNEAEMGIEGSSLLFYYLFEDWRAVFFTVAMYNQRLGQLRKTILGDIGRSSITTPRIEIIPRLHVLGGQIRQSQHLYEGYKNLIHRTLEALKPKSEGGNGLMSTRTSSVVDQLLHQPERPLVLHRSASMRFDRLSDRLELLILSRTKELVEEKDALISTYFNINAQKDSEATARLTRSATLLAKLSVLFLPVSLMTSYFSVQINDLQGVYTSKDYWYTFAVIMSISFLFLFFLSRWLMWVTEYLDEKVKTISLACKKYATSFVGKRDAKKQ